MGGSVHIIVNNLIGFTTAPQDGGSSRYSSDLAKRLPIPIFHVNAEDPDAVVRVGRMALDYRYEFGTPVFIDLIGYRRHGHSEVDDPDHHAAAALPQDRGASADVARSTRRRSARIRSRWSSACARIWTRRKTKRRKSRKARRCGKLPRYWGAFRGGTYDAFAGSGDGVAAEVADSRSARALASYPQGFHIHPKVKKLLEQRLEMAQGKRAIDFGMAEALAFGSLLNAGRAGAAYRAGQPARNFQPAACGADRYRNGRRVSSRSRHLAQDQAWCEIYNSPLSEAAVLGFEYGFSRDYPEALVLWEAQFGDFANGAQIIIDQFIAASEDKWNLLSGIVMLLPHGYEGQGPEHSSARIETVSAAGGARQHPDLPALNRRAVFSSAAAAGAAHRGASRWSCSRRRACCGIRRLRRRSRI